MRARSFGRASNRLNPLGLELHKFVFEARASARLASQPRKIILFTEKARGCISVPLRTANAVRGVGSDRVGGMGHEPAESNATCGSTMVGLVAGHPGCVLPAGRRVFGGGGGPTEQRWILGQSLFDRRQKSHDGGRQ